MNTEGLCDILANIRDGMRDSPIAEKQMVIELYLICTLVDVIDIKTPIVGDAFVHIKQEIDTELTSSGVLYRTSDVHMLSRPAILKGISELALIKYDLIHRFGSLVLTESEYPGLTIEERDIVKSITSDILIPVTTVSWDDYYKLTFKDKIMETLCKLNEEGMFNVDSVADYITTSLKTRYKVMHNVGVLWNLDVFKEFGSGVMLNSYTKPMDTLIGVLNEY